MVISRNVKIGLFAAMSMFTLLAGVNYLKGQDFFSSGNKYYSFYSNVNGLTDSSPVYYQGYKVGSVRSIDILPGMPAERRFLVCFSLDKYLPIPADTRADIYSTDLLGGMGIDLVWGSSDVLAQSNDTLKSTLRSGLTDQLAPLASKAESLVDSVDIALENVNKIIGGKSGEHISDAISSLDETMRNLDKITRSVSKLVSENGSLNRSVESLDSLMSNLSRQGGNINTTLDGMSRFAQKLAASHVDSLVSTLNTTMTALGSVIQSVDSAQGSVGKLLNDTKLYDKLAESSENLNRLLVDVRLNPSRYVKISALNFGKNTYFSDCGSGVAMIGLVYSVYLTSSETPLDFPTEIDGQRVIEYHKDKKHYEYLMGQFRERSDAETALVKLKQTYRDARVKAFDNGKEVAL